MAGYLLIVITFGLMWLLLIRPQQRRIQEHRALVASVQVGQKVITGSGIYGTITALDDETAMLEIAPHTTICIARDAIGAVRGDADAAAAGDEGTP